MSGGIGAISAGFSEMIVEGVILLFLLLCGFAAWKIVKLLIVAFKG